ncbi:MAG: hypothetical protein JWL69_689 [Phycisphaerales bacterium]|nr:hypothetical protein [Phycisphaerales bacterium]MDB5333186.1 hypothetical protein [Phycisphaerales bacterium]
MQIQCINKDPRQNTHEGITHVGGPGWRLTRQQAIDAINNGSTTFYTLVAGRRAEVAVVQGTHAPYLRTHADGTWTDNLLALPECRV